MKYYFSIVALICFQQLFLTGHIQAQKFKYSIPGLDTIQSSFIVGGGASAVLRSGEAEIISSNTLASYWIAFHANGENSPVLDRLRNTQFTSDNTAFYSVSPTGRVDIGLQLRYARVRLDNAASSSMLKVFEGKDKRTSQSTAPFDDVVKLDQSYGRLANVGLRFRFKPIIKSPELVINGGYTIATVKNKAEQKQLNADRDMFDLGATYYQNISNNVYYFFGASIRTFLPSSVTNESLFNTNVNFFLIQRSKNKKFTFYPGISYSLSFKPATYDDNPLIRTADFLFAIGGVQYAINNDYNIFATAGFPLIVNITQPQQEIVRESYSLLSLGFRVGI